MKSKTLPPTICSLGVRDLDPDVDLARRSVTVTRVYRVIKSALRRDLALIAVVVFKEI